MSEEDDQRWRNFLLFRLWLTDSEMEDAAPAVLCILVVLIAAFLVYNLWGLKGGSRV